MEPPNETLFPNKQIKGMDDMEIRFAQEEDLEQINKLRKQLHDLHANGKPEVFKPDFSAELRDYIYEIFLDPQKKIVVCSCGGKLCAFAVLHHITRPENPYMAARDYLDIDEFCVDEAFRRRGIGARMIDFIRDFAKREGFERIELNMWEFNRDALAFYGSVGFSTYRRYMEIKL